jgi:aryl-alcohol dehydrogenase-like predicted oxidoreductase
MKYRPLGSSGLVVSVVGLGCNNFGGRLDQAQTDVVVGTALDHGITLFDSADMYGAGAGEAALGAALGARRHDAIVATKFGMDMGDKVAPEWMARGSREYIRRAVERSLTALGTDYIDLLQYHEPDGITPIEETLVALDSLVRDGLVRYLGTSNMAPWQLVDANHSAADLGISPFVTVQTKYHLLDRSAEAETVPAAQRAGMSILPYYPLANGLLSGKYMRGQDPPEGSRLSWREGWMTDAAMDRVERFASFAASRGHSLLDVAIGGLAALPAVGSVIAGATKPEQVIANAAAGEWVPDAIELEVLDAIVAPSERVV